MNLYQDILNNRLQKDSDLIKILEDGMPASNEEFTKIMFLCFKKLGFSTYDFADELDMDVTTVYRWINGDNVPNKLMWRGIINTLATLVSNSDYMLNDKNK